MKKICILALLTLVVASCATNGSSLEWNNDTIKKSSAALELDIIYPIAKGGKVADSINTGIAKYIKASLQSGESQTTDSTGTVSQAVDKYVEQISSEYQANQTFRAKINAANNEATIEMPPYQFMLSAYAFNKGNVVSVFTKLYQFTGGAHGNSLLGFLNFNDKTGAALKIDQIVSDTVALATINRQAFKKYLEQKNDPDAATYLFVQPDQLPLPQNMGIDSTGIVMQYNQYEIAAYVFGAPQYTIPYSKIANILTKESGLK